MQTKPILLLADSQLLFLKDEKHEYYLHSFVSELKDKSPLCAYIGASNNDEPAFYEIFVEAMNNVGFSDCKMITSSFNEEEQAFLEKADLILLAGGDTEQGLKVFREKGIEEILRKKYSEGTMLIGVSAGAIQLGWQSFTSFDNPEVTEGLKFIPFMVLVHLMREEYQKVELLLKETDSIKRAYEIPFGGGLIFHPDNTLEALRKPINEFILKDDKFTHTLIFPEDK
jgi:peptidase E